MKRILILIVLIITSYSCNSKNLETQDNLINTAKPFNDSIIYFSIKSTCNIQIKFLNKNDVILNMNGKIIKGNVNKSKIDKGFYDIRSNNKFVIAYTFDEKDILIVNQQYQFDCESAKGIKVDIFSNDNNMLKQFKIYEREAFYAYDDIELINDKAYYLEKLNCYKTSEYILSKILLIQPKRVVAWLNLADVNWKQNKKELAKKSYQKYISLMKIQGKDLKKIPQRVYDRIK